MPYYAPSSVDLTAPGPIGSVTPSTGAFTTLTSSSSTTIGGGSLYINVNTGHPTMWNAAYLLWSSTSSPTGSPDTGFRRIAAATAAVTDASTGYGKMLFGYLVEANTAGSGAPNVLLANETRSVLTNEGATAENYHTLPSAAAGIVFEFIVADADGLRVVAAAGDTIRYAATVSAAAGYIRSATIGNVIQIIAINATEWIVTAIIGTWTIDS